MNLFLVDTGEGYHEPPKSIKGFFKVPNEGETLQGTSEADMSYFLDRTDINGEYSLITVAETSIIQAGVTNSKPVLYPWYQGTLGTDGKCLVNESSNDTPKYDIPFLAYREPFPNPNAGIVLRPVSNLSTKAYISGYPYYSDILGFESKIQFSRPINLEEGGYLIGYSGSDLSSQILINSPSNSLYNFLINALMLKTVISGLYINDIPIELVVTPEGYIKVTLSSNVTGNNLIFKMSL